MPSLNELHPHFAAEIQDIEVNNQEDPEVFTFLKMALDKYGVVLIRNCQMSQDEILKFSKSLGPIFEHQYPGLPKGIMYVTNVNRNGEIIGRENSLFWKNLGSQLWHTDGAFFAISPKYSIMSAQVIPSEDGNTEFSFMPWAYDALDKSTKNIVDDLVAEYSMFYLWSRLGFGNFTPQELKALTPVRQKLVLQNEFTGRKALYLSSAIGSIVGWSMPESRYFIDNLIAHATQRENVYSHQWRVGDLIIWDNRQCMHRATPLAHLDQPRVFHRTTVSGTKPTTTQDNDRQFTRWYEYADGVMNSSDLGNREE